MNVWIRNYHKNGDWKSNDLAQFENEEDFQRYIQKEKGVEIPVTQLGNKGISRLFQLNGNRQAAVLGGEENGN